MDKNFILQQVYLGFLIFIRISAIMLSTQSLIARIPNVVRLIVSVVISVSILSSIKTNIILPQTYLSLFSSIALELLLGLTLAFGVITLFSALSFVGRALDLQIGFGAANIIDPTTNSSEALIGTIFTTLAVTLFFILDIHAKFIINIADSISIIPFGENNLSLTPARFLTYMSMQYFLGLSLILPTMIGLLSLDLVIGYISKSMPQMNIYFVSLPLKISAGIFLLFITIPATSPIFRGMFINLEQFWKSSLGL